MRKSTVVSVVAAVELAAAASAGPVDAPTPAHDPHPAVADYLDELVDVEFTLMLPARVESARDLPGSVRVENKGPVACLVPVDLQLGGDAVRVDWIAPDGGKATLGGAAYARPTATVALAPGAFYGQRSGLAVTDPCVRVGALESCSWKPGRYVFTATVEIGIDPAARPSHAALPGLASRAFTTQPVTVEIVE